MKKYFSTLGNFFFFDFFVRKKYLQGFFKKILILSRHNCGDGRHNCGDFFKNKKCFLFYFLLSHYFFLGFKLPMGLKLPPKKLIAKQK